ncbi:MAG: Calx-beta domain-containing protein, partial [Pirellulaceae bacterium]
MLSRLFTRGVVSGRKAAARVRSLRTADRRRMFVEPLEQRRLLATLNLATANSNLFEGDAGNTNFTFTVSRTGDTTGTSSVDFTVAGSGANPASGSDFAGASFPFATVNFAANELSRTISLLVVGDTTPEQNEEFTVTLSNPSAPDTVGTGTALGQIQNDDGPVPVANLAITATSADLFEGNTDNTQFTFTVSRTGDTSGTSSVNFAVTGNGANLASGADFAGGSLPTDTINFAANETSKMIFLLVVGDTTAEPDEGFRVTLSNPSSPDTITTATADGTIRNDDGAVPVANLAIVAADAVKLEGNSGDTTFTFNVNRTGDTTGTSSVSFTVTGSGTNPASAADFSGGTLPFGTVDFVANQTSRSITVNVAGETMIEEDEGFTVTISNPSSPDTITTATAQGTIQDDDGTG